MLAISILLCSLLWTMVKNNNSAQKYSYEVKHNLKKVMFSKSRCIFFPPHSFFNLNIEEKVQKEKEKE